MSSKLVDQLSHCFSFPLKINNIVIPYNFIFVPPPQMLPVSNH